VARPIGNPRKRESAKAERDEQAAYFPVRNDPAYSARINYRGKPIAFTAVLHAEQSRVTTFPYGTHKILHGSLL